MSINTGGQYSFSGSVLNSEQMGIAGDEKLSGLASGGVSEYDDILKLDDMGCYGIKIGKAIYENKISLKRKTELLFNYKYWK